MTPDPKPKLPFVVAVALGVLGVLGLIGAFAWPAWKKHQGKKQQAECRIGLKGAYVAERAYYGEKDVYSENPTVIGFSPDTQRAVLVLGPSATPLGNGPDPNTLAAAITARLSGRVGVIGHCPRCNITIGCAANLDADEDLDVWSISTEDRVGPKGKIPSGVPYNHFNDITGKPDDGF
jgi:type IV pilus assembly protein PilA